MKPAPFALDTPGSVDETLGLLSSHGDDAKVLAGGQSLVPMLNFRLVRPDLLVDINGLAELDYIRVSDHHLTIGALTRQSSIEASPVVAAEAALLATATRLIAHPAIRHRGTIGGSVAHNDPSAEYPLALLALGAEVRVASSRGERTLAASDLIRPWFSTTIAADELLIEISIPRRTARTGHGFHEVARRHGDFALAAAAVSVTLNAADEVQDVVVAASGGRCAQRLTDGERWLRGAAPTGETLGKAAEAAAAEVEPVADIHADADYRRHLVELLVRRALTEAVDQAREG